MPRRKLDVVRPRITIPRSMWDRIEKLADKLALDAPTFCRLIICQQVVSWEVQTSPELIAMAVARAGQQLGEGLAQIGSLAADVQDTALMGRGRSVRTSASEPEPAPEPEPKRDVGFRPRSELEPELVHGAEWSGWLNGL